MLGPRKKLVKKVTKVPKLMKLISVFWEIND